MDFIRDKLILISYSWFSIWGRIPHKDQQEFYYILVRSAAKNMLDWQRNSFDLKNAKCTNQHHDFFHFYFFNYNSFTSRDGVTRDDGAKSYVVVSKSISGPQFLLKLKWILQSDDYIVIPIHLNYNLFTWTSRYPYDRQRCINNTCLPERGLTRHDIVGHLSTDTVSRVA